jgi:hypothetical protein
LLIGPIQSIYQNCQLSQPELNLLQRTVEVGQLGNLSDQRDQLWMRVRFFLEKIDICLFKRGILDPEITTESVSLLIKIIQEDITEVIAIFKKYYTLGLGLTFFHHGVKIFCQYAFPFPISTHI